MRVDPTRVANYLGRAQLDAVVLTSPANITYATGFLPWSRAVLRQFMLAPGAGSGVHSPVFAVLHADGRVALIAPAFFGLDAFVDPDVEVILYGSPFRRLDPGEALSPPMDRFRDALSESAGDAPAGLRRALSALGINAARSAVDADNAAPGSIEILLGVLAEAAERDCSQLMRLVRMVKSTEEIEVLRAAARLSEDAGLAVFAEAHAGSTPRELLQGYKRRIGKFGADFDHFSYSVGGLGMGSRTRDDIVFTDRDVLAVDWGLVLNGYFTDTGGTLAFGEPSPQLLADQRWVAECIDLGLEQLTVGAPSLAAHTAMIAAFTGHESQIAFPHGHAIGLEIRDLPILAPAGASKIRDDCVTVDSNLPLEAGMVLNLELTLLRPDTGTAVEVERTFIVTESGPVPLTVQNRSSPFQAGADRAATVMASQTQLVGVPYQDARDVF